MSETPMQEAPETTPEQGGVERVLSIVGKRDRRTVTVLVAIVALGAGSFTVWASLTTRAQAFTDSRVKALTGDKLRDFGSRLTAVETQAKETHDSVLRTEQLLKDKLEK